jgi:diacylglycerol kinase family enzyme
VNGAAVVRRTPYILIGNNEHAMEGSKPWERGSMTEGRLWVYILRDQSRAAFARILLKVLLGRFHGPDEFDIIRTAAVSVHARRKRLAVSLDGEIMKLESPVQFRSWPRALRAMVPAGSKRVSEFVCELEGGVPSAS